MHISLLLIIICFLWPSTCFAANADQQREQAVQKALQWLRSQQQEDGSVQLQDNAAAMTALAINAHLANGITYQDQQHGAWLSKALLFVLSMQDAKGYFGSRDKSRMYGHGICTLVLAESLGMTNDYNLEQRVRNALQSALNVTIDAARVKKSAEHSGGWHYTPESDRADMSLSGWQMLSLHASEQAGMRVNEDVITGGIAYTRRLCDLKNGSVGYDSVQSPRSSLRGVGLICLSIRKSDEHKQLMLKIAENITKQPIEWKGPWLFYRAYYDAAGLGRVFPELLDDYQQHLDKALLPHQDKEGWWHTPPGDSEARFGKVYRTSMAILALSIKRQLLPAYQP